MSATRQPLDRILHIADLHFWHVVRNPFRLLNKRALGNANVWLRRRHEYAMDRADPYADYIARQGIASVLLTGDFTSTAVAEEFRMARSFVEGLRRRGLQPMAMPGNHDAYTAGAVRSGLFEAHLGAERPTHGKPALHRLPGGTPLLLIDTVCPNLLSSRGRVTEESIAATRDLLATLDGPVVVAGHYPVFRATYAYRVSRERELRNAERLYRALTGSGKRVLYVCGHVHRFSYVQDPSHPQFAHLTTGCLFRQDDAAQRQGEFTEIQVQADGFRIFHHRHEQGWIREEERPRSGPEALVYRRG